MAVVENVDGRLVERLQRLERLVEALLGKPIQVTITMPERPGVAGCTQAELYRLMDLIYYETCEREKGDVETCKRLLRVLNTIKEWSMDELRARLGL